MGNPVKSKTLFTFHLQIIQYTKVGLVGKFRGAKLQPQFIMDFARKCSVEHQATIIHIL